MEVLARYKWILEAQMATIHVVKMEVRQKNMLK